MRRRCLAAAGVAAWLVAPSVVLAQPAATTAGTVVKLSEPAKKGGLPVMEALAVRASVREWAARPLAPQDLSDLLWAANGVNRPDGRRTAASAQNAQDVDIYVFDENGAYLYDAPSHSLKLVVTGDHRAEITAPPAGRGFPAPPGAPPPPGTPPAGAPPGTKPPDAAGRGGPPPSSPAPVQLMLVSDPSRFRSGTPELRAEWGAIDTGIVSQNIALFCAGRGLVTRPRAGFNQQAVRLLLKLNGTQRPFLNLPVGYPIGSTK